MANCQVTDALDASGVFLSELDYWRESDSDFATLERQLLTQKADDLLRKQIDQYIAAGDKDMVKAAMRRLPEYNPTKHTSVEVAGEIKHRHLEGKSPEELDKLIRAGLAVEAEFEVVEHAPQITDQTGTD